MKVACVGNMNNMLFSLCRYLRDAGFDAHLLLPANELNGLSHFFPENDSFGTSHEEYTRHLSWGGGGTANYKAVTAEMVRRDLEGYDYFIVCGTAAAYFQKAGIKMDVFFPHGSDIKYVPFYGEKMNLLQRIKNKHAYQFFENVKKGIQNATVVNMEHSDPYWNEPVERLGINSKTDYFGCPMVYHRIYEPDTIGKYHSSIPKLGYYRQIRNDNDLIVVNQASQTWVHDYDPTGRPSKGSDILIKGFAAFLKQKPASYRAKLILFSYGNDVEASKKLIADLGIHDDIIWHPISSRKEIMTLLSFADFSCGEFKPGCIGGNTTWEAFVTGRCLLHYLNTKITKFSGFLDSPYPFVNVNEASQIANVLLDFTVTPDKYREIGKAGTKWYVKYFAEKSVNRYVELINAKKKALSKNSVAI
jgi:glycosyltransferase involved in cell wall biosynthesis